MVDYGVVPSTQGKVCNKTIPMVSLQASTTGATGTEVIDVVQDGTTWWVVETKAGRHEAEVYTRAPLKRSQHEMMTWVDETKEVRVGEKSR